MPPSIHPRTDKHSHPSASPKPTVDGADASFAIPLRSVALSSSTYFPVMHYMGEKPAIRLYMSGTMYSGNACMHKQVTKTVCRREIVRSSSDPYTINTILCSLLQVELGHTKLNPTAWPNSLVHDGTNWRSQSPYSVMPAGVCYPYFRIKLVMEGANVRGWAGAASGHTYACEELSICRRSGRVRELQMHGRYIEQYLGDTQLRRMQLRAGDRHHPD